MIFVLQTYQNKTKTKKIVLQSFIGLFIYSFCINKNSIVPWAGYSGIDLKGCRICFLYRFLVENFFCLWKLFGEIDFARSSNII